MYQFLVKKIKETLSDKFKLRLKKVLRMQEEYDYCLYVETIDYVCNLQCSYCNIDISSKTGKLKESKLDFIPLLKILNETDKTFLITISGNGEPFLVSNVIDYIVEITRRHYVSIISNLTTKNIPEFCQKVSPKRIKTITASLHLRELERKRLTDTYIRNFNLCQEKRFKINAVAVAYPDLLPEVTERRKFFSQHGIEIQFSEFNGEYEGKKYPGAYTQKEREQFGLAPYKEEMWFQQGKKCNAGFNVGFVHYEGVVYPCMDIKKFTLGSLEQGIQFRKELVTCPFKECKCPVNYFDSYLFEKALTQSVKVHKV